MTMAEDVTEGYKMTEMGLLPEEWGVLNLSNDYIEFKNGLWKGKKEPFIKVRVLRNTNFNNDGTLKLDDVAELAVEEKQFETRNIVEDDIILERSGGGPTQPVGRVVFFNIKDDLNYSFSNFTSRIRITNKNKINPKYIFYFLLEFYISGKTNDIQNRTTGIRNLDFSKYKQILISLPPLHEQRKIAFVLSAVQEAKEKTENVLSALKELKKSMMKHLFTYGPVSLEEAEKVPLKETEVGMIPEHWEVFPVGSICRCIVPGRDKPKRFDGDIPWITFPDVRDKIYVEKSLAGFGLSNDAISQVRARIIPPNSVLMSCVGEFGITVITKKELVVNQQFHAFICPQNVNSYFLAHSLRMQKEYMEKIAHFTTIAYLSKDKCNSVPVPLPSIKEQIQIVELLSSLDNKIETEENKKQALESLFKTLLSLLMTGRIRVKDLEIPA